MVTEGTKLCPICDANADSQHHIKPRADGGTNDPRNLMWLCKKCHDLVELNVKTVTPQVIERLRKEAKGSKAVSYEEYWYILRPDGVFFSGIKMPGKPVIRYDIFFPYESQIELPIDNKVLREPNDYIESTNVKPLLEETKSQPGRWIDSPVVYVDSNNYCWGLNNKLETVCAGKIEDVENRKMEVRETTQIAPEVSQKAENGYGTTFMPRYTSDKKIRPKHIQKGRPKKVISATAMQLLEDDSSLREKAQQLGVSKDTVRRQLAKN